MEDQDHQRVVVAVAYPDMVVDHQRVVVAVGLSPLALPALVVDHQQNLRLVDHQRVVLAVALSPLWWRSTSGWRNTRPRPAANNTVNQGAIQFNLLFGPRCFLVFGRYKWNIKCSCKTYEGIVG